MMKYSLPRQQQQLLICGENANKERGILQTCFAAAAA
jgi:hypothetical protein